MGNRLKQVENQTKEAKLFNYMKIFIINKINVKENNDVQD